MLSCDVTAAEIKAQKKYAMNERAYLMATHL